MNTLDAAIRNNAAWCECVCRAHGAGGAFNDKYWESGPSPPRFYPDLVTLVPDVRADQLTEAAALARPVWHVKDSFALLDLSLLGARVIIEAQWQLSAPSVSVNDDATAESIPSRSWPSGRVAGRTT